MNNIELDKNFSYLEVGVGIGDIIDVINGKVKVAGRLPSKEELTGWLNREK